MKAKDVTVTVRLPDGDEVRLSSVREAGFLTFPTLYQRTATGAIQKWEISVHTHWTTRSWSGETHGVIKTVWGQVDGAQQTTTDVVRTGKNAGKANATTAVQQAEKEAEAKWKKKQAREGYVPDLERAKRGESDKGGTPPMLAVVLADINPSHLQWPADWQIKFNGNRVEAEIQDGKCRLWSRKGKDITTNLPHIVAAYERVFRDVPGRYVLDGEGYRHRWSLQCISGFFRTKEPKPGFEELGHYVYDLKMEGSWEVRREALRDLFRDVIILNSGWGEPAHPLYEVVTTTVHDLEAAWRLAREAVRDGYEGGILRQLRMPYAADKRSVGLAKLKDYRDAEFEIVGMREGRGKFARAAVFNLRTADGHEFECCAPGDMEEKALFLAEGDRVIGKLMTVRYFELSDDGCPLQGTPVAVRDYE